MATTGFQASGDFGGAEYALKYVYGPAFEVNIEKEQEVLDVFKSAGNFKTFDGPDGKSVQIAHTFHSGGGVSFGLETDPLPLNQAGSGKQSSITLKKLTAAAQISGTVMRRSKSDKAVFMNWAQEILPRRAQRAAWHEDRAALGLGTGIVARVNDGSPDATITIDAAFGIAGLTGMERLLHEGDSIRLSPNSNGTSPRTETAVVQAINYDSSILTLDALPTSGADNDYIFVGDTNVYGLGAREIMGLEGIIDDGNLLGTFQGLSRTTYPKLKAQQIDASTATWGGTLNEDLLDYAATLAKHRAGGNIDIILSNASAQRAFWRAMRADRVINDPRGKFAGGKDNKGLSVMIGSREVYIRDARKVPDSRTYLIDSSTILKYQLGKGKWDDTTGSTWLRVNASAGHYDAFVAYFIKEMEMGCGDPSKNVKLTGLTAS